MIEERPLEVVDFTGGITDYFLDGQPNQAQTMDNLFINPNRKPVTRWGSEPYTYAQIPLGQFRISHLEFLTGVLLAFSHRRLYIQLNANNWQEIEGPPNDGLFPVGDANSVIASAEWQDHLFVTNDSYASPQKIYIDDVGDMQIRNAGLPDLNSGFSVVPPAGAGSTYLYAACHKYTYKVGNVTYLDRGPVYFYPTLVEGGTITTGNGATVSLPTTLSTVENWDSANIEIEVYRTINAGDDFFLINTVPLGTPNFVDENEDGDIVSNEGLYTNGGVFSNGTPPKSKFVHVVNNTGYYANLNTGVEDDEYLIRQSIPGDPDSVPPEFFERAEQKIKGLSSIYDRPMLFCERYVYRIDNIIDLLGQGSMDLRRIDDQAGCVGQNSIVQTHKGIFWAGETGFYWSDGFKVQQISHNINETYRRLVQSSDQRKRIYGVYDSSNDRVIWSIVSPNGAGNPDTLYILDLKWGIKQDSCFTTASGGESFKPTALAFRDEVLYRGDTRGYVLQHARNLYVDPKIDINENPANWEKQAIIYLYKSSFIDFGSKFLRKMVQRILISAANLTNLSLAIVSSNDNNRIIGTLQPIEYKNNITWGDDLPLWGDPEARWNYQGLIEQLRRFPAKGLRCQYKQIQLTNAEVEIVSSDLLGEVTVNSSLKTATLGGSKIWLQNIVDYYISFESDDYTKEYLITDRTDTTLVFSDVGNGTVDGTYGFKMRGIPKGEVLQLEGYTIFWNYLSKTHTPYIKE